MLVRKNFAVRPAEDHQTPISIHKCNEEDYASFYSAKPRQEEYFKSVIPYLYCLDDVESIEVYGTYETMQQQLLMVHVKRCVGHDHCKSEAEIDQFISTYGSI